MLNSSCSLNMCLNTEFFLIQLTVFNGKNINYKKGSSRELSEEYLYSFENALFIIAVTVMLTFSRDIMGFTLVLLKAPTELGYMASLAM